MGFGGYSEARTAGARHNLDDYRRRFGRDGATVKMAGHNRCWLNYPDGTVAYVLHTTPVATFHPDGTVTLRDGGWPTMTTRRAMQEALRARGFRLWVYGANHLGARHVVGGQTFGDPVSRDDRFGTSEAVLTFRPEEPQS